MSFTSKNKLLAIIIAVALSTPFKSLAASIYPKVNQQLGDLDTFIIEIFLWFIFITLASFVTYFVVNTFILISNNRWYRQQLHKKPEEKSEQAKERMVKILAAVKTAEKRLGLLGAIIVFFIIAYLILSSYVYLPTQVREHMWQVIYYGVGFLTLLIIFYSISYLSQKMQLNGLPDDDLQKGRIFSNIDRTKRKLKILILIVFSLIMTYLVLLVTIMKEISQLSFWR
jgi:ABC-type multidrug transport system permease subunit